ncbi:hypothetical protein [endosymbiont GvMRE of Glomus versiforme]|uniref:hypothetical protein n=1 Tax=endosymbiont GvMRE of Glomus versiforme TaxID=2039283 RepID=UPI000EE95005|nr:hypothetical protein [endosymbiont GvMRE of Glomus versiforme]RHZ37376.1 hypothetical protein GvMRE_I1g129 [endosymbiont GvMRE of Glomus versiforme]
MSVIKTIIIMSKEIKCSKSSACERCQKIAKEKLAKLEKWEIKRRKALENLDLEKEVECSFCPNKNNDGNNTQYSSVGDYSQGYSYEKCSECDKDNLYYIHKSNQYGDETKFLKNKSCNCEIGTKENLGHSVSESSNQTKSKTQSNKSLTNSTNTERKKERESKPNYLPWILGGIGLVAIITGLVWYFTRKENK